MRKFLLLVFLVFLSGCYDPHAKDTPLTGKADPKSVENCRYEIIAPKQALDSDGERPYLYTIRDRESGKEFLYIYSNSGCVIQSLN